MIMVFNPALSIQSKMAPDADHNIKQHPTRKVT